MRIVFDTETNGLDDATKIHCLCYYDIDTSESRSLIEYSHMISLLATENLTIIGHDIIRFDVPTLERLLGIDLSKVRKIDTLGLSWYLYPSRKSHNLNDWGNEFTIDKPVVEDWINADIEIYTNRCQEDVKINTELFKRQLQYLSKLYDSGDLRRIMGYLTYKLECAREMYEVKWRLNTEKARQNLSLLEKEREVKAEMLSNIMPEDVTYKIVERPRVMFKKDGTPSVASIKWLQYLSDQGLPEYHNGSIKVEVSRTKGNPRSYQQVKAWLFDIGWVPETFKYVRKSYNDPMRVIPQISLLDGSDVCPSIKALYEVEPRLESIEGFFIINHRITILDSFLANVDPQGFLRAEITGFTNTLRFIHTTLVNLPTVVKPYGEMIRGVLIAPDADHVLCGCDMAGLEEATKHHYVKFYDESYVDELRAPGYDPHLDMCILAGYISEDEKEFYKWYNNQKS